jgi:hypothetical protein
MMGLQYILKFIQPFKHDNCCLESIFPPLSPQRHSSWRPPSSCSSLESLFFRPDVQLSDWEFPSLASGVGSLFPGSHVFLFLGFLPYFIGMHYQVISLTVDIWEAFWVFAWRTWFFNFYVCTLKLKCQLFMYLCLYTFVTFLYWKCLRKVGSKNNSKIINHGFSDTGTRDHKHEFHDNILIDPAVASSTCEERSWGTQLSTLKDI